MNTGGETGTPDRRNQFLLCTVVGKRTKAEPGLGTQRNGDRKHGREGLGSENGAWDSCLRNPRNAYPQQSKAGLGNLLKPLFSSQS